MLRIALLILATLFTSNADAKGEFTGYVVDNTSCGKYVDEINNSAASRETYRLWIAGFITGLNYQKDRSISIDLDGLNAWVRQYCESHPLEFFINAAVELDKELDKPQHKH